MATIKSQKVQCSIRLLQHQLGTIPKDPNIYKNYIASKVAEKDDKLPEMEDIQKVEEKGWTGFMKDDNGPYILNYMILGFLKEAANVLKEQFGIKNFRNKVGSFVFVGPRKLYFIRDGQQLKDVDGFIERPIRGNTAQGPIVALGRSDYIAEGTELTFELTILENKEFNSEVVRDLFEYGKFKGLGQFRNGSYGSFDVISYQIIT